MEDVTSSPFFVPDTASDEAVAYTCAVVGALAPYPCASSLQDLLACWHRARLACRDALALALTLAFLESVQSHVNVILQQT